MPPENDNPDDLPPSESACPGQTVERVLDGFMDLRRRGEEPSVEEIVRAHPDHADTLQAILPAALAMEQLGAAGSDGEQVAVGRMFGEFLIVRLLGRGGMGAVYEAVERGLDRHVALKLLPDAASHDETRQRFLLEARAAAQLVHDHIVPVFRVGCVENCHYYAMKLIDGISLAELIRDLTETIGTTAAAHSLPGTSAASTTVSATNAQQSPENQSCCEPKSGFQRIDIHDPLAHAQRVARVGRDVALALHHSHQQGIIHRDIKPSNILIDAEGKAWVTDFGIARLPDTTLTRPGDLVGTLRYMAPEQFQGQVDSRTDVWGVGLTLYEFLTLQPAFRDGEQGIACRALHQLATPPRPRALYPAIPAELEAIVLRAMAADPRQRYASADELASDLQRFLDRQPIAIRSPFRPWLRPIQFVASLAAIIAVASLMLRRQAAERPLAESLAVTAGHTEKAQPTVASTDAANAGTSSVDRRNRDWFFKVEAGDDREVAEWVFEHGGKVNVIMAQGPLRVEAATDLPEAFNVMTIDLWHCQDLDADILRKIVALPKMTELVLNYSQFEDAWMPVLLERTMLTSLQLGNATGITDRSLETIGQLTELQYLNLNGCDVSDGGVAKLATIPQLNELVLFGTRITDVGLKHLEQLQFLELLDIGDTACSTAAVAAFRKSHPRCLVQHNRARKQLPGHRAQNP